MNMARIKLNNLIPDRLRFFSLRNQLCLREVPSPLVFKIAETEEELTAAFRLLHDHFLDRYGIKDQGKDIFLSKYHALPTTSVLIVRYKDIVVGTATIIRETPFGLPNGPALDLDKLRHEIPRLGELAYFAIRPEFRSGAKSIFFPFYKYMLSYAIHCMNLDGFTISVHPERAEFYEGILLFKPISDVPIENLEHHFGKPATVMTMKFSEVESRLQSVYGAKKPEQNLYHYLTQELGEDFRLPNRHLPRVSDPVMNPTLMDYYYNQQTQIFADLTDVEKGILNAFYPFPSFRMVIPQSQNVVYMHQRKFPRFEVDCRGAFESGGYQHPLRVLDVSKSGLQVLLPAAVAAPTQVQIQVSDRQVSTVEVEPIWKSEDGMCGLRVRRADEHWYRFIGSLRSDYEGRLLMSASK